MNTTRQDNASVPAGSVPAKPLLTPEEYYRAFDGAIGRGSIYELLRAGRIRHVRLGRKILIPRSELDDFPIREASLQS